MIKIYSNKSEINENQWKNLCNESPLSNFFQTQDCFEFYDTLSFLEPFIFGVSEDNVLKGIIVGYIIAEGNLVKRYFSRRAIIPGGILLDNNITDEALNELLKFTRIEISSKSIYIELRNYNDYSKFKTIFENNGFKYQAHLNFHISTPDIETVTKKLSSTKRRDIKISIRENVQWYDSKSIDDLKAYYLLLSDLYKTKIKSPLFAFEFFEKIINFPFSKFFVIKYNEKVIGGSICVLLNNKTVFEWFVCGLDGKYKNVYPSTLATWAAIEFAANNGFKLFDMMGAGKPDEGYGVREFKAKFGGELVEHGRFLYLCKPTLYSIGKYVISKLKNKK